MTDSVAALIARLREATKAFAREFRGTRKEASWSTSQNPTIEDKTVYVTVTGLTGVGKSIVYTEIATALSAIGLKVEHADPKAAAAEMRLNDHEQLLSYEPRIVMRETNVARARQSQ